MNVKDNFKWILEDLMEKRGITQAELSRLTSIPTSLISNYATGKKNPALSNAVLIAEALGVTLDILAGREPQPSSETKNKQEIKPFGIKDVLIKKIDKLNEKGCIKACGFIDGLLCSDEHRVEFSEDFQERA